MLRKLLTFILTISILWVSYPAYAMPSSYSSIKAISNDVNTVLNLDLPGAFPQQITLKPLLKVTQQSSQFVKRCLSSQPNNGLEEINCNVLKKLVEAGVVVAVCYTADGLATLVFPPFITVAPACNYLGIARASQKVIVH